MILDTNAVSALAMGDAGIIKVLAASERHHLPEIVTGNLHGLTTAVSPCLTGGFRK